MSSTRQSKQSSASDPTRNPLGGKPITDDCKVYSCRMCRKLLFTSNDLLAHDSTKNSKGHKKFKNQNFHSEEQKDVCTSLFLDPDVATWVAEESREVQSKRLAEMEKERQLIEDEEIFGPGGRPKTPPLQTEGEDKNEDDNDEDADEDRFGDDFENGSSDEENHKVSVTDATSAALRIAAEKTDKKANNDKEESKKKPILKKNDGDDDSDEEIISSDDDDEKTSAKKKKAPAAAAPKKSAAAKKKAVAPSTGKPAPKAAAAADSDEEIIDSDKEGKDDDEDDFDDDDDFRSNVGEGGGANAARRMQARVTGAALDIVDPDTIYCPHCSCKVGTQCWTGSQCSCAAWVTPSFKVHAKAVDAIPGSLYLRLY